MPRSRSQASTGPKSAPFEVRSATRRVQNSSATAVTNAPATTSVWPFKYLVAECMTRSQPSLIGWVSTAAATVLSIATRAPAVCPSSAAAAMSVTTHVGLAGLSSQSSFVLPGRRAALIASRSPSSTSSTCTPHSAATRGRRAGPGVPARRDLAHGDAPFRAGAGPAPHEGPGLGARAEGLPARRLTGGLGTDARTAPLRGQRAFPPLQFRRAAPAGY